MPESIDLSVFFDIADEALVLVDQELTIVRVNPAFEKMLGWKEAEVLGVHALTLLFKEDSERVAGELAELGPNNPKLAIDVPVRSATGAYLEMNWKVQWLAGGRQILGIGRTLAEVKAPERFFFLALDASPTAMLVVDEHGMILYANQHAHRMLDFASAALNNLRIESIVPPEIRDTHQELIDEFMADFKERQLDHRQGLEAISRTGKRIPVRIGLTPIKFGEQKMVVCALVDVSKQIQEESVIREQARQLSKANRRLSELASTDELTGLSNRRMLMEQLELIFMDAKINRYPISLAMVDIDHFKEYNDEFGHPKGDVILVEFAKLLQRNARESDIVARYGGEEFALLLPHARRSAAMDTAERLRSLIETHDWKEHVMTASFGVATVDTEAYEADLETLVASLLEQADRAMYHSKRTGRNRVTHYEMIATQFGD